MKAEGSGEDSRYSGRDLNPGPPEYEAAVLTTRPRRSIRCEYFDVLLFKG
jgi:hypothetical protein